MITLTFFYTAETTDWPDHDAENNPWCIAGPSRVQSTTYRRQIIDLLDKGFTPEYLDEVRSNIEVGGW